MAQSSKLQQRKSNAATLSVVSNTLLVIGKLIVGIVTGSVSVISEAIHSGMDLAAALIAFFAVRKAAEPADQRHPFGHGKYENISGAIEALLIFAAAAWIISEAIHKLIAPADVEAAGWGVLVMLVSAGGEHGRILAPFPGGEGGRFRRTGGRCLAPAYGCVHLRGGHGGPRADDARRPPAAGVRLALASTR